MISLAGRAVAGARLPAIPLDAMLINPATDCSNPVTGAVFAIGDGQSR